MPRRLLRLLLVGLGLCLIPQAGPGQLPVREAIHQRRLGPPIEREGTPQVLEFEPVKKPSPPELDLIPPAPAIDPVTPVANPLPLRCKILEVLVPTTPPFA